MLLKKSSLLLKAAKNKSRTVFRPAEALHRFSKRGASGQMERHWPILGGLSGIRLTAHRKRKRGFGITLVETNVAPLAQVDRATAF
jgi:hypothetical protein